MDIQSYMTGVGRQARAASRLVAKANTATKNRALTLTADAIERDAERLLAANARDLAAAHEKKLDPPLIDRLTLSKKSLAEVADGLRQIAQLPDPIGEISELKQQPSGIKVGRMRVPLGVIAIIYESRPDVTADAAGLCIKAGNACILRGGSEAIHSNQAIAACVHEGLKAAGLPETAVLRWTDEVMTILDDPDCAALFDPGSAAEVPVTGLLGTVAISGQIDRLAVSDSEVVIVDYKTNRPPPLRAEDVPPLYLRQMAAYRGLLRRIYPDRPVRCALLWTDGPSLMTLPDQLLDPHAEVSPAL